MTERKKKKRAKLPAIPAPAASMTECTGILPAQIETAEEGENLSALEDVNPPLAPKE